MDISFFDDIIKEGLTKVPIKGKDFYLLTPSSMNGTFIGVMSNEELDLDDKAATVLAMTLCNEFGELLFDSKNEKHVKKVKALHDDYKIPLIESLFPAKKK